MRRATVTRGKVISFDRIKGYGFVTPETGGEDVFIHVNDLYSEKDLLTVGSTVEFRLEEGDRGPKASAVTVLHSAANGTSTSTAHASGESRSSVAEQHARNTFADAGNDDTVEVLTPAEFEHEVTEALLRVEPELTSRQIMDARKRLVRLAQDRNWVDR
jgi:CspA family cold shock protein